MKFFFMYYAKDLVPILKTGILELGSQMDGSDMKTGNVSGQQYKYITMNIDFLDSTVNKVLRTNTLIFSKKILEKYGMAFNNEIRSKIDSRSIIIKPHDDNPKGILIKIQDMIERRAMDPKLSGQPRQLLHEVLFDKRIDVKKYLRIVICDKDDEYKIKNILANNGYPKVRVMTNTV